MYLAGKLNTEVSYVWLLPFCSGTTKYHLQRHLHIRAINTFSTTGRWAVQELFCTFTGKQTGKVDLFVSPFIQVELSPSQEFPVSVPKRPPTVLFA